VYILNTFAGSLLDRVNTLLRMSGTSSVTLQWNLCKTDVSWHLPIASHNGIKIEVGAAIVAAAAAAIVNAEFVLHEFAN